MVGPKEKALRLREKAEESLEDLRRISREKGRDTPDDKIRIAFGQELVEKLRGWETQLQDTVSTAAKGAQRSLFLSQSFTDPQRSEIFEAASRACRESRFDLVRGDDPPNEQVDLLAPSIADMINESRGLLCVMTPANTGESQPNFWLPLEIGIAIACKKPYKIVGHEDVLEFCRKNFGETRHYLCTREKPFKNSFEHQIDKAVRDLVRRC